MATVGFASAVMTFWPRPTVDIGDPIDLSDPLSAPITVVNTSYVPFERVSIALGLCNLRITPRLTFQGPSFDCGGGSNARLITPQTSSHRLGIDERWRGLLREFFPFLKDFATACQPAHACGPFSGGDITIVVSFAPWPWAWLHLDRIFGREKQFRFEASNEPDGKFRWFPKTIDR